MGAVDKDPGTRGVRTEGIQVLLQGRSPGGVDFRVGDVGPDPPHGAGPGNFSTQGRAADHREAYKEGGGLGVSTTCVSYGGD